MSAVARGLLGVPVEFGTARESALRKHIIELAASATVEGHAHVVGLGVREGAGGAVNLTALFGGGEDGCNGGGFLLGALDSRVPCDIVFDGSASHCLF